MTQQQPKPSLCVRQARRTRRETLDASCRDREVRALADDADVILLPLHTGSHDGSVFPSDTTELYRDLNVALPSLRVEIAVRDEHYRERVLRHFLIDLGVIVLQYVVAPLVTAALWDYVKKRTGLLSDARARVRLLVSPSDPDEPLVEIEYDGPAEDFSLLTQPEVQAQLDAAAQSESPALLNPATRPEALLDPAALPEIQAQPSVSIERNDDDTE